MNFRNKMPGRMVCMLLLFWALMMLVAVQACAEETELTCIVADGQYVNVRNRPSSSAATWGVLHTGETILSDPAEITDGFFRTIFRDRVAYVSVRYFEIPVDAHYVVEANGRVRVRNKPGGSPAGFVRPGDSVYVAAWRYDENGGKWARCTGGQYISAEYLHREE